MKFTLSMLRDFVDTPLSATEIGDLLTMSGFELEEITEVAGEDVLDVNIMANRGDGASVVGMAREVLAKDESAKPTELYRRAQSRFSGGLTAAPTVPASVTIESTDCRRYACRILTGIQNGESPAWLQDQLVKIGQRPISLLVDLTNYVMIETGQPLHAFDLDLLPEGKIVVRNAKPGEKLKTLDGIERELQPNQMMICDASRPVGVAGVMGGATTEVSSSTTSCLLESANFDAQSVRKTRKQLGLQTEASYRFERFVDPEQVVAALNRFSELLRECQPNVIDGGLIDDFPRPVIHDAIPMRLERAEKLLGMTVPRESAISYLTKLGFAVKTNDEGSLLVTAPSWRSDIAREEDLIEEIGRVHGYDKIPELPPAGSTSGGGAHGFEAMLDRVREAMLKAGLDQMITFSLRDVHPLDAPGERTRVRTPHSPDIAILRNSLLPSLADSAHRNGNRDLHLFELGRAFPESGERTHLGILSMGKFEEAGWLPVDPSSADFFTLKGTLECLSAALGAAIEFEPTGDPRFHPTRQAKVTICGLDCGFVGQIHPDVAIEAELPAECVLAEIDLTALAGSSVSQRQWHAISRHPGTRRDVAILVPKTIPFRAISDAIAASGGEVLERHWLFDVYDGQGIPEGYHSLAIALQLRKLDATFTDEEANQVRDSIVAALVALGAQLR